MLHVRKMVANHMDGEKAMKGNERAEIRNITMKIMKMKMKSAKEKGNERESV